MKVYPYTIKRARSVLLFGQTIHAQIRLHMYAGMHTGVYTGVVGLYSLHYLIIGKPEIFTDLVLKMEQFGIFWFYNRDMHPNDADGMGYTKDPDQTAPFLKLGAV